jgi:hypothetical protein
MTITLAHVFSLLIAALLAGIFLQLRQQKIFKTLAANLVTIQIKNEDTGMKLVGLYARTAGVHESLLELLKGTANTQSLLAEVAHYDLHDLVKRLQACEDKAQQSQVVNEATIEDKTQKLRSELEAMLKNLTPTMGTSPSILDQIQGINIEQLLDLAKKSGAAVEKVGPLIDLLGKARNGVASKN